MKYSAVLFDLDGTLLNSLKDIADSVNLALGRLGFPQHELEAYKYFVGDGREAMAIRVLPEEHRDVITLDRLVGYIDEEYSARWSNNTRPYQGIREMLQALTDLDMKMAILSNKPQGSAEEMVCRLLPQWHFELIVGALPSVPKKPDPAAAVRIAKQLEIPPTGFLYLGDSDVDMKTATAADMYPVGALWGYRTAGELLDNGAKELIQNPVDLLRFL